MNISILGEVNLGLRNSGFSSDDSRLNGDIVENFFNSLSRNIFNLLIKILVYFSFISRLGNIFSLVFNFIIISICFLDRDVFDSGNSFVVSVGSFIRDLFNSRFSFVWLSKSWLRRKILNRLNIWSINKWLSSLDIRSINKLLSRLNIWSIDKCLSRLNIWWNKGISK